MQMFGNILQIFLTIFLSLPWWMGRYVGLPKTYIAGYFHEPAFLMFRCQSSFHPHIPFRFLKCLLVSGTELYVGTTGMEDVAHPSSQGCFWTSHGDVISYLLVHVEGCTEDMARKFYEKDDSLC